MVAEIDCTTDVTALSERCVEFGLVGARAHAYNPGNPGNPGATWRPARNVGEQAVLGRARRRPAVITGVTLLRGGVAPCAALTHNMSRGTRTTMHDA